MNKIVKRVISCLLVGIMALGFTACKKENISSDGKTVDVRIFLNGYGTDWLYSLKDKFEEVYKDEGYKINILTPSSDVQENVVINELASGGGGVDLYFPGAVRVDKVTTGEYGVIVEELTDSVYSKPAIRFDGTEEEITIREKLKPNIARETNVYYDNGERDKEFSFMLIDTPTALCYNEYKLNKYGLEVPKTTNELIDCFDTILNGTTLSDGSTMGPSSQTGIYPHTFLGGSSGYPQHAYYTWLVQCMGYDKYQEFITYCDENGEMREDGWKVYQDQGVLEMLKIMYQVFDLNYATNGSTTQDADQANVKVVTSETGAVFMSNGNWMINEVKLTFPNEAKNLRAMNFPVASYVGVKAFGTGTTANITDEDECDKVLSKVVGYIDEGKTRQEIVTLLSSDKVTATEAEIAIVEEARNVYYDRVSYGGAYITKDSPVKDIAALFLRMCASDDNSALMFESNGCTTVYDTKTDRTSEYAFCSDISKFANKKGSIPIISLADVGGLRKELGHNDAVIYSNYWFAPTIVRQGVSKYELSKGKLVLSKTKQVYFDAAQEMYDDNWESVKDQWSGWISRLG